MPNTAYRVQRDLIANAYDAWKLATGRSEGQNLDKLFLVRTRELLNLLGSEADPNIFPTRRQRWTEWRKSKDLVELTRDHCRVIKALTNHDLTPGQDLGEENDFTSIVTLVGQPGAQRISNSPNKHSQEQYSISVDRIAFRQSDPIRVPRAWLGTTGRAGEIDAGSVVFGLRQAQLSLAAQGSIVPEITDLTPDNPVRNAEAHQVCLADDPKHPGRWIVTPVSGKMLKGSVYLHKLATAWDPEAGEIYVIVEAKTDWIEADFQPNGEIAAGDEENSRARKHLIDKVLRLALSEGEGTRVFSKARVKKATPE